jgi:hypothetical protein
MGYEDENAIIYAIKNCAKLSILTVIEYMDFK